jgi:Fe-S-cluster containining protein
MTQFPCSGCGLCCQYAGRAVVIARNLIEGGNDGAYVKEVAAFPFEFDATGRCSQLNADNSCAVYDQRPDICSVERNWAKHFATVVSKSDHFKSSAQLCNSLMIEANISPVYLITIPE